jgi:sirohydrochlorin cobaltochelatase
MKRGIILFVHGARDPRWAEPFRRLRAKIEALGDGTPAALAFLEHGTPDLAEAAAAMASGGVQRIRIVPMFFGRGGHLRNDLPRQLELARARAPGVGFEVTEAAGESEQVLEALAKFALGAGCGADE